MKHIYGETDASLSFERTHWRDAIWPEFSRIPSDGETVCSSFGWRMTQFRIDRYPEMVEIILGANLQEGPVRRKAGPRPDFGLKCTSATDTAVVLVSLASGLFQISLASGSISHGRLSETDILGVRRLLAQAGGQLVLFPRSTDDELETTARVRERWKEGCSECLLPPIAAAVYYDTPVRILTPFELPDSLQGSEASIVFWVNPAGTTDEVRFLGTPFGQAAVEAIKWQRLRFKPATAGGKAIGAWVEVRLKGRHGSTSPRIRR